MELKIWERDLYALYMQQQKDKAEICRPEEETLTEEGVCGGQAGQPC